MHRHRFYISPHAPEGDIIHLPEDEAHHALRAVRVREGDPVTLFDGRGREFRGAVAQVTRREVAVHITAVHSTPRPAAQLTLLQAWLHRDKPIETIIRRGTALGVARFVFFRAARSERPPQLNERWERVIVEACKQCGRTWLPELTVAESLESALSEPCESLLIATADKEPQPLRELALGPCVALLIGPEGDFTPEEVDEALAHGARPISLGAMTLRSEEAAIVATTLTLYELGLLGH